MQVRAKKHLGQHFLNDKNIARKIVDSLEDPGAAKDVLEVGPGMGVLTDFLVEKPAYRIHLIDIDRESIAYLHKKYPALGEQIIEGDFLKMDFSAYFPDQLSIIGNFPYNISSQILFKMIDNREKVEEMVGMFQKEVAERVIAKPGTKEYGILSVFMQAYFDVTYLFTVNPGVFNPPPKVKSAVIKALRKPSLHLDCDEKLFFEVVKLGFNQRRKTLRNSLKRFMKPAITEMEIFDLRPERLGVEEFVQITNLFSDKS